MEDNSSLKERLELLEQKYAAMGQDLISYLDGLLYSDYLTYWDYIHLDTLLSLQSPKTKFPDENIFIIYHQITELYFKLCINELEQLVSNPNVEIKEVEKRASRVCRYFENLTRSFEVMVDGMDKEQFLKFRMSLLPASGFQSAQYRMIEIMCTDFINLIDKEHRQRFEGTNAPLTEQMEFIYWKAGATELATGKKTLTLSQFERKYTGELIRLAERCVGTNLRSIAGKLHNEGNDINKLREILRKLDLLVNVNWPLSHYKSAVRYLQRDPESIKATGGTNWQKYLPPRFQKRIFYPEMWSEEEITNWGKTWVEDVLSE